MIDLRYMFSKYMKFNAIKKLISFFQNFLIKESSKYVRVFANISPMYDSNGFFLEFSKTLDSRIVCAPDLKISIETVFVYLCHKSEDSVDELLLD